jgi:hypothetical protein
MEPCLYEDPEAQQLLCYLVAEGDEGSERRIKVFDGHGEGIGAIRRIPPSSKLFKHTWRIEQPGHPEIVGRNQWSGFNAKRIAQRAADNVVPEVLNAVTGMGPDDTHSSPVRKSRTLEWVSDGELVMISQSIKLLTIKADWLDRRLAFAFSVLGDRWALRELGRVGCRRGWGPCHAHQLDPDHAVFAPDVLSALLPGLPPDLVREVLEAKRPVHLRAPHQHPRDPAEVFARRLIQMLPLHDDVSGTGAISSSFDHRRTGPWCSRPSSPWWTWA